MRTRFLLLTLAFACATTEETDASKDDTDTTPTDTDTPTGGDTDRDTDGVDTETDVVVDTDTDVADTDTDTCPSQLVSTTPLDGEPDFGVDDALIVAFTGNERATATATLVETASGTAVTLGAPVWSGLNRVVTVRPVAPLQRQTDYTLTVTWSCGTEVIEFTTTDLGDPVDPADVEGRTYAIDLATLDLTQPVGIGGWLLNLVGTPDGSAAIRVLDIDTTLDRVDLELGLVGYDGVTWTQDLCVATLPSPNVDYANAPAWSATTPTLPLSFGNVTIELLDVDVSGIFAPGGDFIGEIRIAGGFDTRDFSQATLGNPATMCGLAGTLSGGTVSCVACPGQVIGTSCLPIVVENTRAYPADPFVLEPRTPGQIAADPTCTP